MNKSPALIFVLAVISLLLPLASVADEAYRLRAGDRVLVSVWREDALAREVQVLPDGSITFPLAGRVVVAGSGVTEAEQAIAERLRRYMADPVVSVSVTAIEGNTVYVLGQVERPGPIVMAAPMTVLQALSIAGGVTPFAKGNSIQVLRDAPQGRRVIRVRYNDLVRGQGLDTNVKLQPGDTILVP